MSVNLVNKKGVIKGTNFRWVVPQLPAEIWTRKEAYKVELLYRLKTSKTAKKGIKYYAIAIESHADGNPHLDLFLIFKKAIELKPTELDFLCDKHGDLTRYRSLTKAILAYGSKEDTPLSNCIQENVMKEILDAQQIKEDQYGFFQSYMVKNPFSFDLRAFCDKHDYFKIIKNFNSLESTLKKHQEARANSLLQAKPGLKQMPWSLIKQATSDEEYAQLTSWGGYGEIIKAINSIAEHSYTRPFKSRQLLIVGMSNTGKTSLNRLLSEYVATYEVGVNTWWPKYQDGVYEFFSWNEFTFNKMPYTELLKLLEGTPLNLEQKGSHGYRANNQLIIMNSNLDWFQHLKKKFNRFDQRFEFQAALDNFPSRVQEIRIPKGKNLFLLLKVIKRLQEEY